MKKPIAIILAAIMMFALCACGNTATDSSDSGPTYVFTFGTVDTDEHPSTMSAKKLGEILNEKAPGKWQINVHPNSTLGGAAELVESIQMGNVDMACPATSFLANYVPSIGVLDLPYMFTNTSEAYAVLDGDVGQQLAADVEAVGIKCLSYWEVGFRCIANSARPINSVEDVSGLRLRIMSNEIHQALFSALGVDPVPMGLADALVANQQGTIDGMDNPMSGLYTTSVYEFDKYIAVTNHVYTAQAVIMSNKAWSSMTPDDQAIFMEAVKEATEFDREQQAIILIIAPLLAPVADSFGIDPIQFGCIFVFTLAIGQATPPFGACLFVSSSISGHGIMRLGLLSIPFVLVLLLVVILTCIFPDLATLLPSLMAA